MGGGCTACFEGLLGGVEETHNRVWEVVVYEKKAVGAVVVEVLFVVEVVVVEV